VTENHFGKQHLILKKASADAGAFFKWNPARKIIRKKEKCFSEIFNFKGGYVIMELINIRRNFTLIG